MTSSDPQDLGILPARLSAADHVPELVRRLYAVVAEFERLFPGRKFPPMAILCAQTFAGLGGAVSRAIRVQRCTVFRLPVAATTFVLSANLHRRHLNPGQQAAIAAAGLPLDAPHCASHATQ